jgi:hypothetical protein
MQTINLAECRQRKKELQDDYNLLVRRRKALERFAPIDSRPLTEIDKRLEEHPLLKPEMEYAIRHRAIYLLWLKYEEADALLKREILLSLRELHRALPQPEEFADLWWRWLDEFEEEEIASGERTIGDRKYVWSPDVAKALCHA